MLVVGENWSNACWRFVRAESSAKASSRKNAMPGYLAVCGEAVALRAKVPQARLKPEGRLGPDQEERSLCRQCEYNGICDYAPLRDDLCEVYGIRDLYAE